MDDICESVDTEIESRKLANDIDIVLTTGGFIMVIELSGVQFGLK